MGSSSFNCFFQGPILEKEIHTPPWWSSQINGATLQLQDSNGARFPSLGSGDGLLADGCPYCASQ
jgi:hypothetical protein